MRVTLHARQTSCKQLLKYHALFCTPNPVQTKQYNVLITQYENEIHLIFDAAALIEFSVLELLLAIKTSPTSLA
jgi:hypothetical protein